MKINTKEKYDNLKRPLIPKSITHKKEKRSLVETFNLRKLIPFIHEKDRTNKPYRGKFRINPSLHGLDYAFMHPAFKGTFHRGVSSKAGAIKHAGEVRQVKKLQRRRVYLRALCG